MNRNLGLCILFSILTCGIYGIYWMYMLTEEMGELSGDHSISGTGAIIFNILTCGIYGIYWAYKMGQLQNSAETAKGLAGSEYSILYLVLAIFGLNIVTFAIMQSSINSMAK